MLALLLSLAVASPPPLEGWWPPEGADPHPSALSEPVRARATAATVSLGGGRSGVFVSREGLVLTSASAVEACARRLRVEGRIGPRSFIAPRAEDAPVCPGLEVRIRLDSRDVRGAVEAARRAGSTEVEEALLGACRRLGADRRCALVDTEDGGLRLLVWRRIRKARLRFYPGPDLGGLGGPRRAFEAPWLRLDGALVSVDLGRAGAPGYLRLARRPPSELGEPLWVLHHPGRSLRWGSALETRLFAEEVLPAYQARLRRVSARQARLDALLGLLEAGAPAAVRDARRRELDVLGRVRGMPLERRLTFTGAFTAGRAAAAAGDWRARAERAETTPSPPLLETLVAETPPRPDAAEAEGEDPAARSYFEAAPTRHRALVATSAAPVGPDGRGDLRISRGWLAPARGGEGWRTPWGALLVAAERLGVDLPLPKPLPWSARLAVGFELAADVDPRGTGGPVVDARGDVVGVLSAGDRASVTGIYRFHPEARVGVTSAHALELALARAFGAPALAAELRN